MSGKYAIGDILDVGIEKIVPRGLGLAFAEKLTLMVPLAAPGDALRVKIVGLKKRLAWAEIVGVIEPGPDRITPPCPYFGACGGCDFQQLRYEAQLRAKVGIIRDCLIRIGKIDFTGEIPILRSPAEFEYRSRVRWQIDREAKKIGYFRRDSHEVIDVERCPIIRPALNATLAEVRSSIEWESFFSERFSIAASAGDDEETSIFSTELADAPDDVSAEIGGERYVHSAEVFFQANRSLVKELIETAIGDAQGELAIDLYSGVGLFSLPLARRFKKVVSVEENRSSVSFARLNAEHAELNNIEFANNSVKSFLTATNIARPAFVLIDPPRAGTEKGVIESLAGLGPDRISYVSCEPSILARDLRILIDSGYTMDSITGLDMFPQSHHVETVVHLSRA